MAPGTLRGRMSAETQTFVSTTTRRSDSPHFVDRGRHIALDLIHVPARLVRDPTTAIEQRIETANPLVPVEATDTLLAEPPVDRLPDELCDGTALSSAQHPQRIERRVIEVDVRPSHESYIIHRSRSIATLAPREAADEDGTWIEKRQAHS
jgi:hypothetical protein